ncbi:MAG: ATP-binding protein [Synergistaceae bacterium]|nr:ATP-binding protein [Synergistaceae bacterium]
MPLKKDFEESYPLSKKISRFAGEAIRDYSMIKAGDSILIGLSGGKDSLLLSLALAALRKRSPVKFTLRACLIDQSDGSMEPEKLTEYLALLDIPLTIITHPTYRIMKERGERSPCSLCANLRRGILAGAAKELGCGVIALGHHKDDAAETVLLNLFYGGRFKCFHPHLYMSRTKTRVIRPLIYVEERNIALEAERLKLPVVSSCCPYGDKSKRKDVKEKISALEKELPELKSNIIHALKNLKSDESWPPGMLNE